MVCCKAYIVKHICFYLKEEKAGSNEDLEDNEYLEYPEYLEDPEHPENPENVMEVCNDEESNCSNTFFEATTHSNLQVDFPPENPEKFKCSYDCDFSTFSIEEYMEHFQTVHLHQNLDPKAICPSDCCPSSSTGCKYVSD